MPTKVDRRPLISYLRVQRANDRAILDMLRQAANDIELELFASQSKFKLSDRVRTDQLLMAKARINRRMERLWLDIGDQVQAGKAAAAAAAIEDAYPQAWLKKVMPEADVEYLMRSARATAERGLDVAEARVNLSRVPLAESVYKNGAHANGIIDEIVNSGLASGLSAKEIADGVSAFINPNTPGGVKYAAMRLGRTELNNAFHATQVQAGIDTPWTTALKWNLSGSHPVPDECNEYAESVHYEGGEAGVFKPEEVPAKPHPNCLCYTTPVTDDREEFIRKLQTGEYDDYLDHEFGLDPSSRFATDLTGKPARVLHGTEDHADLSRRYRSWRDSNGSEAQNAAFERYTRTTAYQKWNATLRGQATDIDMSHKDFEQMDELRALLRDSPPLESDVAVSRGIQDPRATFGPDAMQPGTVIRDDAFVSTTMDREVMDYYKNAGAGNDGGAVVSINVPKGTRVGVAESEAQILLSPGTEFRVVSDTMVREIVSQADYDFVKAEGLSPSEFEAKLQRYHIVREYRHVVLEVL